MASSTNQEHQQTAGATNSNLVLQQQQQQQQQQELLKILAQHFHNQFYQMNGAQQNNISAVNQLATGSVNHKLHHPQASSNLDYQQQRNQQFQNESSLLQPGGGCLNLVAPNNTNSAHQLFQQSIRSHAANNNTSNLALNMSELPLDFAASLGSGGGGQHTNSNSLNLYSTMNHDMNLLSALGLNLTNNQLVLSLQQQSLHQAAAAAAVARQYELARGEAVAAAAMAAATATTINTDARNTKCPTTNTDTVASNGFQADQDECQERQLKFSIKTILGGTGSPKPGAMIKSGQNCSGQQLNQSLSESAKESKFLANHQDATNKLLRIQTEQDDEQNPHQLQRGSDYDATESYSDSSSINASTPTPQTSASMLTFNQTYSSDHHRATQLNSPGMITASNLAAQNQNLKFHHQQQAHTQQRNNNLHQQHHSLPFLPGSTAFPWTVAARGKPRRGMMRRAVFSDSQRVGLEKRFQLQKYISKPDRKKLAEKLGLRDSQVKIWFQNRRMKWRNSKERELLSAGGSREQTLPTRNNPNPDLSDVGETIKRLTTTTTNSSVSNVSFNK